MSAFAQQLLSWIDRGEPFAIATVVHTEGSAPRAPGSTLLVSGSGEQFVGSVSAGCLDNDVIHAATEVLASKQHRILLFGPDGSPPWQDGLSCGGKIEVRIDPWFAFNPKTEIKKLAAQIRSWLRSKSNAAILSRGEHHLGFDLAGNWVGDRDAFSNAEQERARIRLSREESSAMDTVGDPLFVRTLLRPPRLFLVGAVDTTIHLVSFAQNFGFECIVIDPRRHYGSIERFPIAPDQLINSWPEDFTGFTPNHRDAALVLTHDPKIDDRALIALLKTNVGYIGALGSQRSHAARLERLKSQGAEANDLERIEGPAGLRLGASNAAGIALGMMAGIVRSLAARGITT
jgi:xanthine dehydrogenase accessory factor